MPVTATRVDRFTLTGRLDDPGLQPWIARHARRLGLSARIAHHDATRLAMNIAGPPDLLDAMEAGCLLGPIGVWVSAIVREPGPGVEAVGQRAANSHQPASQEET